MGKRELIIAGAFIVVAIVAYQLTAPPPKNDERGFSLSRIFTGIKREMRANSASATLNKTGTVALRTGVTEVRLAVSRSVPLTVLGERRDDIGYEMSVESTGPDDATAREYAGRATLKDDDLGTAQKLDVRFPDEGQQTAKLTLRVPSRLQVRVEGSGRLTATDVRAVDLRNFAGDATISKVAERVSGGHRSGDLTITHAGTVDLTLSSSRARLTDIDGAITLNARSGDCAIASSRGTIEAMMANVEFTITEHAGAVQVSGENGTLRVALPTKTLAIDARRMLVEVTLAAAIPATILTSDEPIHLTLAGPPGVTLDAVDTAGGAIRATDFGLEPTKKEGESRLAAALGGGGPRIVLRNSNAEIVIGLRK